MCPGQRVAIGERKRTRKFGAEAVSNDAGTDWKAV